MKILHSWLKEFGAVVIDADRLGHRVYEPGTSGFEAVVNEFGHDIVAADGTINRQLLGGKVFGRPDQMKRLTDIVWPEIRRLAREEVTELKRRDRKGHIVLEAAVLVEANWFDLVDEVWVVTVEPDVARARLMARTSYRLVATWGALALISGCAMLILLEPDRALDLHEMADLCEHAQEAALA